MIRLLLLDVDGTLTVNRDTLALDPIALEAIQRARGRISMGLVTGNALIVAEALARYIGLGPDAPLVAENGCIVEFNGVVHRLSSIDVRGVVLKLVNELKLKTTYQFPCRMLDFTLEITGDEADLMGKVKEYLASMGLAGSVDVESSGYAIHIHPKGCGKPNGVVELCRLMSIDCSEVAYIGDSDTDADVLGMVGLGIAVGNATSKAKSSAKVVVKEPSGRGAAEAIDMILKMANTTPR